MEEGAEVIHHSGHKERGR